MAPAAQHEVRFFDKNLWLALAALAALALAIFADVLFTTRAVVPANRSVDMSQFADLRTFGAGELKRGHLALWNPRLFSGAPFFGGFQSAMLYPPNAVFLILSPAKAITFSIALHLFLAGAFTYAWVASRGLHPLACFLSAVMYMFSGPYFLHIYAGHLPHLCAMAWAPCLFLSIDRLVGKPSVGWVLFGASVVALLILAGQPQYLFYLAVAAGVYSLLRLAKARERKMLFFCLLGIVIGGAGLGAVQLLTALAEASETSRNVGVAYDFAAMFSFPPENFLTFLAPDFFGSLRGGTYWGRCYLWEMSIFLSVTGLALAFVGGIYGDRAQRHFALTMIGVLLVLALGVHTPLFKFLYEWVPGFNKFRSNSKFIFLASLFMALLAGLGLDGLIRGRAIRRPLILGLGIFGVSMLVVALGIRQSGSSPFWFGAWHRVMLFVSATGESYVPAKSFEDTPFVLRAALEASTSLLLAGGTLILAALLLWFAKTQRKAAWGLVALAVVEMFLFARGSRDRFALSERQYPALKQWLDDRPGDYRILNLFEPNSAMGLPAQDIWGMDPGMIRRYGEAVAFSQGVNTDLTELEYIFPRKDVPFLKMLRCRFVFGLQEFTQQDYQVGIQEIQDPLPHLQLVSACRVIARKSEILSTVTDAAFHPREEVILETAPDPEPQAANEAGSVTIVDSGTDYLDVEANVFSACILLITDTYAKGWHARPLPGSSQQHYQVMPANYCLRAIPLAAGRHRIRVEYLPVAFTYGKWLSLLFLLAFAVLAVWSWKRAGRKVMSQAASHQ
jgi:hypothetical protein